MREERRMILQMLKDGNISVEEAERLLEAVPVQTSGCSEEELAPHAPVQPKRLVILVTEGERTKVNIRLPFSLARVGLKMGLSLGTLGAKHSKDPETAQALEALRDIDINEILGALSEGDITLPYTIVDVDDDENGGHVQVTLQ